MSSVVTFSDGSTITYTYTADGTKLRTEHKIGNTTTTTDYCGNVIYENGTQKLLLTEEGYVNLTQQYHYYLKDHQGNNRVVINQGGTVEETNHYYPFGGLFASTNTQPYKYNGKELDTKKGLNWYDYRARHYDAALGRFTTVDPLAEKYYNTSLYTYCNNNPIRFIDPNGKGWNEAWPHLKNSISGNFSFGLNANASISAIGVTLGFQVNAGSVQIGSDGFKATKGVGVNVGIIGIEAYENAYELDASHSVKEEGTKISVPLWSEDNKTITTFDSTGKNYEEVSNDKVVEDNIGEINISAGIGIGAEIRIDTKELWNFISNLFK